MIESKTAPWVEKGYEMVSDSGFSGLSVELIARNVGKNKSSFYHHFGDLEVFKTALLSHHVDRTKHFAAELEECESIRPGMIHVFLRYKTDFLFHKQLRIERGDSECEKCCEEVHKLFESAIEETWAVYLQLENQKLLARTFLRLVSENSLLQITKENYLFDWLDDYLSDVSEMLAKLKPSG